MDWMLMPLRRYAEFSGRSQRKEYWMFALFTSLAALVLGVIEVVAGISQSIAGVYGPLSAILVLATLVPSIAVSVRRLHDTDRSGWWLLAIVIPYAVVGFGAATTNMTATMIGAVAVLIVAIALLVFFVSNGTQGPNRFGPDPKNPAGADVFA